MPAYNRAYCMADSVRSVIDQTYKNWELIIVDDGSEDSRELVEKLKLFDDERIHYYRIAHSGNVSYVRNYGNSLSKGKYIVVHDSDDMAFPNRLEEIYNAFEVIPKLNKSDWKLDYSPDVVYHGMYIRAHDMERQAIARVWKPSQPFDRDRIVKEQYIPGQIAYKKSVWEEIKYDERFELMDDWPFLIDLALKGKRFARLDKDIYEYVSMNDSININGEEDGRRARDTKILIQKLKFEYQIEAHAEMTRFLLPIKSL